MPIERRNHPAPQPLPAARPLPRPRQWSAVQRSGQNWLALCAALFLLGSSGAVAPVHEAASGAWLSGVWQSVFAGEPAELAFEQIVSRLRHENPRLDGRTAERIAGAVQRCEHHYGVAPRITLAVMIVESNVRPAAVSPKGAIGLMQVMPHMFRDLGLPGNVAHIESNVEAGCILLADNMRRLGEDRGISAYFWGARIGGDAYLGKVKAVRDTLEDEVPRVPPVSAAPDGAGLG